MKSRKLTETALLLAVSFVLSWLESFIPIRALFPIPGLKLGFANIAVTAALLFVGKKNAFAIVLLRPLLALLLFGNVTSATLSLCGGTLALCATIVVLPFYRRVFSLGGLSVISAVFHGIGQCAAVCFFTESVAVLWYLPLLCAASSITGLFTGFLMNGVAARLAPLYEKNAKRGI